MDLCHEKQSETWTEGMWRKYKGRVVFSGDIVKDEHDVFAVFSEQGTSASHMAAATILDAIARLNATGRLDATARLYASGHHWTRLDTWTPLDASGRFWTLLDASRHF